MLSLDHTFSSPIFEVPTSCSRTFPFASLGLSRRCSHFFRFTLPRKVKFPEVVHDFQRYSYGAPASLPSRRPCSRQIWRGARHGALSAFGEVWQTLLSIHARGSHLARVFPPPAHMVHELGAAYSRTFERGGEREEKRQNQNGNGGIRHSKTSFPWGTHFGSAVETDGRSLYLLGDL